VEPNELHDERPLRGCRLSSSFNDEERLFCSLFRRYNNRIRPVRNSSEPVNVALTFSLMQIHHLVSSLDTLSPVQTERAIYIYIVVNLAETTYLSSFFLNITNPVSCLHHFLPPPRSNSVTSRLRSYEYYPRHSTHTKWYCSFIQYDISNYQHRILH